MSAVTYTSAEYFAKLPWNIYEMVKREVDKCKDKEK